MAEADLIKNLPVDEAGLKDLVYKIRSFERTLTPEQREVVDPTLGRGPLPALAGVSPQELQEFLEDKAGLSPAEEAQGTPLAAAVSIAYHC